MAGIFNTIDFFNYIGNVKKGQTLFIKKRKYITKFNFWYKFLKKCYREDLDKQLEIINHNIVILKRFIKNDNSIIYINNMLFEALDNLNKGLILLYQTYNKPEILQIFLRRLQFNINFYKNEQYLD